MSSIGSGYDLSASQFSPDGRVFQVEYATKAVEASGTVIALRCKDGVAFAIEKKSSHHVFMNQVQINVSIMLINILEWLLLDFLLMHDNF